MTNPTDDQRDPRQVRFGLAIICLVVVMASGLFVVVDAPVGKALMFAVAATAFVRGFLLFRSLRAMQVEDRR